MQKKLGEGLYNSMDSLAEQIGSTWVSNRKSMIEFMNISNIWGKGKSTELHISHAHLSSGRLASGEW